MFLDITNNWKKDYKKIAEDEYKIFGIETYIIKYGE